DAFSRRGSYADVVRFWIAHPTRAARLLWTTLAHDAPLRRVPELANLRRSSGAPIGAKSWRCSSWSRLRTWLLDLAPVHLLLWYSALLAGAPWLARRETSPFTRALLSAAILTALLGILEFG